MLHNVYATLTVKRLKWYHPIPFEFVYSICQIFEFMLFTVSFPRLAKIFTHPVNVDGNEQKTKKKKKRRVHLSKVHFNILCMDHYEIVRALIMKLYLQRKIVAI